MKLANKLFIAFVLLLSTEAFADVLFEPSSDTSQASKIELDNKTQALEGTLNLQQDWILTNAVITLKGALKTNGYNITLINSKLSVTELNSHQDGDLTLTSSTFTAPVSVLDQIYRWKNIALNDKSSIQSHISNQVDLGLNWQANQITVDESSGFDVSAKSTYLVGTVNYRTGSHAGLGSYNSNASYGSTTTPYTLGTASRSTADTYIGNGGGVLKLTANQLQLNGYLRANGTSYSSYGAAGGSIWVDANQLLGAGKIQANAGAPSGNAYTGGGGRIAVYANSFTDFNVDNIEATNGLAETDKRAESYVGSVGTIYLKNKSENTSSLLLKNNNATHSQRQTIVGDIVGIDSVQLINSSASADAEVWESKKGGDVYLKNTIFTFPVTANEDPFYLQSITLSDSSSIQSFVSKEQGLGLNLNVDTIIVDETSGFDVSAKSTYLVGTVNYRTGSHAGLGSYNSNASYGSTTTPYTLGTASRSTADTYIGNGGGVLKLTANKLQLNGYLRANGTSYSSYGAAGGSIWVDANQLSGAGKIQANAGAPSGNAYTGGGGRIAVYANSFTGFNVDNIEATNGLAETDKRAESYVGSVGTIYLKNKSENTSSLLLKNNNATHSQKQTEVGDISGYDFIALKKANARVSEWESKKSGKIQLEKSILTLPLSQSENPFYLQSITLSDNSSIQSFVSKEQGLGLNLNVDTIIVDETSGFDVSAKSTYLVGTVNYRTGSHAGLGSYNSNASYGSTTTPYTLGTASRSTADTYIGNGGGVLKLTANKLQLNGYLRANGTSYGSYGAAGGSIWVDANQLLGAGKIQANAGAPSGNAYTGGGGYVAVYDNDITEFNISQIEVTNGLAARDKRDVGYVGGVSTVHIENKTTSKKTLKLVNKNSVYSSTTATFEGYDYIISSGVNLNLTGNINVDNITRFDGVALKLDGSLTLQQDWALSDANITLKGALKTNGYNIILTNSKLSVTELNSHQDSDLILTNSTFTAPVSALDQIYHWKNITLNDKSSVQSHISDQVDQGLNWQVNQITVDATSGFDLSAKSSYIIPRTNTWVSGSHAGRGASESNDPYGLLAEPYTQGSAAHYNGGSLGYGGGALKLTVNRLQLDGYLRANGGYNNNRGAAGGSVWLDVGTLSGAGQVQANAGSTHYQTGGGGRVAVYANDLSEFEISRIEATNGLAAGDNRRISYVGGVGTVHIENKTTGEKTLRLVNNGGVLSNQVTRISNLSDYHILLDNAVVGFLDEVALQSNTTINNSRVNFENNFYPNEFNLLITNSELAISGQIRGSGGNIELDKSKLEWPVTDLEKPAYWQTIKLQNNSTLTHKEVDSYPLGINIVAHSFEIDENSKVDVSSKGRLGIDKANYAGGSYGALGGNAKSEPYGEDYVPFGGGIGGNPSYKTRGGGSFKLTAASMLINGKILANGMANNYSGGSGGSIWLSAGDLAGSGDINADGASGSYSYSGGGSGGRVAVYYAQSQGSLINRLSVKGAENAGQAGTVYTNQRQLAVLVSDTSPSNTGYVIESLNSFIVRFYQPIDAQTFTTEDVRINGSVHNNLTISQLSATEFLVTLTEPITKIARHEIIIGPHIASINGALMDQNQNGITAEEADAYRFFIDVKQQQKLVDKNITISGENNILEGMRVIVDDAVVTASGNIQLDSLELINGAKLLVSSGEALQLIVNELKISKNSIVNASSKGSKGSHGLAGQGGSYAGSGGSTVKNPVTANKYTTRGSYSYPEELGEGGLDFLGSPSYSSFGGGAIHIVTKSLVIDGQMLSNGDDIDAGTTGAGSGGSILIETESIEGSGRIEARGGHSNFAGSGSGGRVAVLYHENHGYEFSRNINVSGGGKVIYPVINAYGNIGAAGTLYLKDIENDHETLVFMHDYYADSMGGNSVSANADVIQFANAKANLVNVRTSDFISKSSFLEINEKSFIAIDTYALDLTVIQSSKAWDIANGIMQINKGNTLLLKGKTQWNSLIIDEGAILSVPEYQENDEVPYVIAQEIEIKKGRSEEHTSELQSRPHLV